MSNALSTPYLALDLDAFDRNVALLADTIVRHGAKRWRPHVKALRSPALALHLQRAGASGVTCATAREAQAMVAGGIDDVLIATQVVQPADIELVAALNRHASVTVAVDDVRQLKLLASAAESAASRIPVVVEIEVGLKRAGVSPEASVALARLAHASPWIEFRGFMAWEGHATRITDPEEKRQAIAQAVGLLGTAAALARQSGFPVAIVSCGGTGTFEVTSGLDGVTEIQAGGGVFGDLRYREDFEIPVVRALTLWSTVLSRPTPERIVCDAGWKHLAAYPKAPRLLNIPNIAGLNHAAEHLTVALSQASDVPAVGERIEFEIGYADATTFLHRRMLGMRGGRVETSYELVATN